METVDLIAIGITNFVSLFIAVALMRAADRMRKRKLARLVLDEVGERAELEKNFRNIISTNFPPHPSMGQDGPNE